MQISRRHPQYEQRRQRADYLLRAYQGGDFVKSATFLDRYPREEADIFNARLNRSYYVGYLAAVVDQYVSEVFRIDPVREMTGDAVEEFAEDATGGGEPLTSVMQAALTSALAAEVAYITVDLDSGERPYVHFIHPENLLDFSMARDGMNWALVAEHERDDTDPDENATELTRYRLWTRDEVRVYDEHNKLLFTQANSAGVVPIVTLRGDAANLPSHDIADVNRRIFNLSSQLDEILIRVTFPQFYIEDVADEETGEEERAVEIGTGRVLALPPGTKTPPGYIAPPDGPARLQIEERERLIKMIYSLAGLQKRDPDAQSVQSGVSKAYDFKETNSRLAAAAQATETAEAEIFDILRRYGKASEVNVTYQKDFNVAAFTQQLEDYLKLMDAALPAAVKRMAAKDVTGALVEERGSEERRTALEAVEAMPDADFESAGQSFSRTVGSSALPDLGSRLAGEEGS